MELLSQFKILTKKNLILLKRHYVLTGIQLALPIILGLVLLVIASPTRSAGERIPATYQIAFNMDDIFVRKPMTRLFYCSGKCMIGYTPVNDDTVKFMKEMTGIIDLLENSTFPRSNITLVSFESDSALADYYKAYSTKSYHDRIYDMIQGIVFQKLHNNNFKYTIRMQNGDTSSNGYYQIREDNFRTSTYSDFVVLQHIMNTAFINSISSDAEKIKLNETKLYLQSFEHSEYVEVHPNERLPFIVTVIIVSMLSIFVPLLIIRIILEKSSGMRELLRTVGLNNFVNYSSWFLYGFIILLYVSLILLMFMSVENFSHDAIILKFSNKLIIWIFLISYMISLIFFCLFMSVFFTKGIYAVIFSIFVCQLTTYGLIFGLDSLTDSNKFAVLPFSSKVASCLLPNAALYWGFKIIFHYETIGVGLNWQYINQSIVHTDSFSMVTILWMLYTSCAFYAVLTWYFDAVWPWQTGVPKPFYFPFTRTYWCGHKIIPSFTPLNTLKNKGRFHEDIPFGQAVGIHIKDLKKNFRDGFQTKMAVDGINLEIFEGQITVLLGHNGAGKTTTISMITGMYPPTEGSIEVSGYDVVTQLDQARKYMGYCPQHNICLDELTVKEHLEIIATLKTFPKAKMNEEIRNILELTHLTDKSDSQISTLSGGMKRKFALAMAMVAQPKVLLLDEPTSGLDPEARREVWDILQSIRNEKTILLTTHHMEEADALGDRIAIMSEGNIFCSGSGLYLKNIFGAGYHLRMITEEDCDVDTVLKFVNDYVSAKIERQSGRELSFIINTEDIMKFPLFFENFEQNKEDLKIETYGLSVTNMEDVFLKVGEIAQQSEGRDASLGKHDATKTITRSPSLDRSVLKSYEELQGLQLYLLQFFGLLCKRFHHNRRQISSIILQIVFPLGAIALLTYIANTVNGPSNGIQPYLDLSLPNIYPHPTIVVHDDYNKAFDIYKTTLAVKYSDIVKTENVQNYAIQVSASNMAKYIYNIITGAYLHHSTNETVLKGYVNNFAQHSIPIALNSITNTKCRLIHDDCNIQVANHPFPYIGYDFYGSAIVSAMVTSIFLPMGLSFLTSACILFIIAERNSKSKHLQLMTGVSPILFWLANGVWDFIICQSISMVAAFLFFHGFEFSLNSTSASATFFIFSLSNMAMILQSYVSTFLFKRPVYGFAVNVAINLVFGITAGVTHVVSYTAKPSVKTALRQINDVFQMFPMASFTKSAAEIVKNNVFISTCDKYMKYCSVMSKDYYLQVCCNRNETYNPYGFKDGESGYSIRYMYVASIVLVLSLIILETPIPGYIVSAVKRRLISSPTGVQQSHLVDEDVLREENKVDNLIEEMSIGRNNSASSIIVQSLRKEFRNVVAVDKASFSVPKEKCFGLLGINGAGKTTTFSMLTGDLDLTSGNAFIGPHNVVSNTKQFQKQIGYCPQFDGLLDLLTGEELLYLFARLRGVPNSEIKSLVKALVQLVNLEEHANKKSELYSGGNKRKLSIAAAVIGLPPMLFLDEPTSGIDPVSRRQIWQLLTNIKLSGISVVLTSHSMEECEALCDELTIMVKGRLQCIGSVTHLKDKFGQGFTIMTKSKLLNDGQDDIRLKNLADRIQEDIPETQLENMNLGLLTFHVSNVREKLSHMFSVMEKVKNDMNLEDYAITATTLEEVFLSFAKAENAENSSDAIF